MPDNLRVIASLVLISWLGFFDVSQGALKIYFLRHAEGGHNVVGEWKDKPKEQWPAYVGNPNIFTPNGEQQVVAATQKLKARRFDLVAVSPVWRARHTVLPFLRESGLTAELWPELIEIDPLSAALTNSFALPPPATELFSGALITVPADEKGYFKLLESDRRMFKLRKAPLEFAADVTAVSARAVEVIRSRFGHSDKSILLVGHDHSGRVLLHLLLKNERAWKIELTNAGLWMVEEQPDGTFKLRILNDKLAQDE